MSEQAETFPWEMAEHLSPAPLLFSTGTTVTEIHKELEQQSPGLLPLSQADSLRSAQLSHSIGTAYHSFFEIFPSFSFCDVTSACWSPNLNAQCQPSSWALGARILLSAMALPCYLWDTLTFTRSQTNPIISSLPATYLCSLPPFI